MATPTFTSPTVTSAGKPPVITAPGSGATTSTPTNPCRISDWTNCFSRNSRLETSWNGYEHNALLLNRDHEEFSNVGFLAGCGFEFDSRAVVSADLDNDGRMDLLVSRQISDGRSDRHELHVLVNTLEPSGKARNWISLRVEPPTPGTRVLLCESGESLRGAQIVNGDSFCAQHPVQIHFGLGTKQAIRHLEVIWPDGTRKKIESPRANEGHLIRR